MKSRLKLILVLFCVLSVLLVGCNASDKEYNKEHGDKGVDESVTTTNSDATPNRKIIYKVDTDLTTNDITNSVNIIKDELNDDEWLDLEKISEYTAFLVVRVKSDRLDQFLDSISEGHDVTNFNKTATDVSLDYQDKSNLIRTYEAERDRLLELYEEASLNDMIEINRRLSEIEIEIQRLQGELNQFDSLVDYSEVKLNIYLDVDVEKEEELTFGDRVWSGLSGGFSALVIFLEALIVVIVTLLPWAVVFGPISYGVYRLVKRSQKKKKKMKETEKFPEE
ncbi:DUF4349 domain-containing protein [Haloplasma contractile]|uniref:DUF4349 domain-containing protein n=1 Tax=Haloplasma contractile SSD-17B TaxID=1033810 RepID=F7Q0V8_9MOLU|nr:DUF4349 domain-containing protein [Haloplasma contractile]ERJ11333.1 hypothetical protein HLPCO_002635 [Haloplasma contractile SSD-17B]